MICLVWAILAIAAGLLGFAAGSCYLAWYLKHHPEAWLGHELVYVMAQYQAIQAYRQRLEQEQTLADTTGADPWTNSGLDANGINRGMWDGC